MSVHAKLQQALVRYDRLQEEDAQRNPRRHYNPHALPQYLRRLDDVMADIGAGATPQAAIVAGRSNERTSAQ